LNKCPTCLQIVPDEYKNKIVTKAQDELKELEKSVEESKKRKEQ
jgi:hypothetical protein